MLTRIELRFNASDHVPPSFVQVFSNLKATRHSTIEIAIISENILYIHTHIRRRFTHQETCVDRFVILIQTIGNRIVRFQSGIVKIVKPSQEHHDRANAILRRRKTFYFRNLRGTASSTISSIYARIYFLSTERSPYTLYLSMGYTLVLREDMRFGDGIFIQVWFGGYDTRLPPIAATILRIHANFRYNLPL